MTRELLFSVTKKDFDWQYVRGSGSGGQKINKTSSAVRCTHKESGASSFCQETRSREKNKQLAFMKTVDSPKFQAWLRKKISIESGADSKARQYVEEQMKYVKIEGKENGKWVELSIDEGI